MTPATYLPRWTKRVPLGTGGRDPLGLSRVSQHLTSQLLSGIITTTWQARYYSVYCWILHHIATTDDPRDQDAFTRAFQRREAAFAIATLFDDDRRAVVTPVGVNKVRAALKKTEEAGETSLSLDFPVLENAYGGFGQNYGGSMYELGLWYREAEGFEQIIEGPAELLADAVEEGLTPTPYHRKKLWREREVALDDLRKSASRMSLDALTRPAHEVERDALIELMFALDEPSPSEPHLRRRLTLTWILWVVRHYEHRGLRCRPYEHLEWCLLYAPIYFGVINLGEEQIVTIELPRPLPDNLDHWRLFCAQQYLTIAHESALAALLAIVSITDEGLELSEAVSLLLDGDFGALIEERAGTTVTRPGELLAVLGLSEVPQTADCAAINAARPIVHPLSENQLSRQEKAPAKRLAQSLMLLASLYARWRALPSSAATHTLRVEAGDEPWVGNRLTWIDAWFAEDYTWERAATELLDHLIRRHQDVLYDKGDLKRCWLELDAGRVRHVRDLHPQLRGSRFPNAVSILRDLGLMRIGEEPTARELAADEEAGGSGGSEESEADDDPGLVLTALGKELLAKLERTW